MSAYQFKSISLYVFPDRVSDVNMPVPYGEGSKAFSGLQEQILCSTDDDSLSAWTETTTVMLSAGGACQRTSQLASHLPVNYRVKVPGIGLLISK